MGLVGHLSTLRGKDLTPLERRTVKSPMLLWKVLATELGSELGVDTSRDYLTVASRVEHEGDEFLSITLPGLRKAFEQALDKGQWDAHVCTSFSMHKSLPRFLGGFLELVFDRESGAILEKPNVSAIRYIRQLTGMFGSLLPDLGEEETNVGCSDDRVKAAFEHYLETDDEVASHSESLTEFDINRFRKALDIVFGHILGDLDRLVYTGRLRPRHSGGATAERLKGNQKWTFPEWTDRLEEIFPYLDNTIPSLSLASHRLKDDGCGLSVHFRSPEDELPVRVIAVPKTREKPRVISIEPSYMQYMQQAVSRELMRAFRMSPAIRQMIALHDRTRNQQAAQLGSFDGSLATLDLKDASDRLSWRLVQEGFASYPWLVRAMDASRSRNADVAGVGIHPIAKFASMGSALTFPIQTMVFTTIALMGIAEARGTSVGRVFARLTDKVRVFGDDIIIPTDSVPCVVRLLETYGFKLNTTKSFWTGKFRESCGGDYYAGEDVGYVKVRRHLPRHRGQVQAIVSAVSLRNRFYEYGYWATAAWMDSFLGELLRLYPTVTPTSSLLGRVSYLESPDPRYDAGLQVPVETGYVADARIPVNAIDGVDALTRYFFEGSNDDDSPLQHLQSEMPEEDRFTRSGRPTRATLKRRTRPI